MKRNPTHILVVTPYTQRFGIAVFSHTDLLYFAVKTFRRPRTIRSIKAETAKRLKYLIDEFVPTLVIAKSLTKHQSVSDNHRQVAEVIRRIVKMAKIPINEISFEETLQTLVTEHRPTKSRAFAVLRKQYPELARFVHFQNRSQEKYYTPMLTAVAIGFAHRQNKLQNHKRRP